MIHVIASIEKRESLEALHAHLAAPHMARFRQETEKMTDGVTLAVLENA